MLQEWFLMKFRAEEVVVEQGGRLAALCCSAYSLG